MGTPILNRLLSVLETAYSTLENPYPAHMPGDEKWCQTSVGASAEKRSSANLSFSASSFVTWAVSPCGSYDIGEKWQERCKVAAWFMASPSDRIKGRFLRLGHKQNYILITNKNSGVLMVIGRDGIPDHKALNDNASRTAYPELGSHKVARIVEQSVVRWAWAQAWEGLESKNKLHEQVACDLHYCAPAPLSHLTLIILGISYPQLTEEQNLQAWFTNRKA